MKHKASTANTAAVTMKTAIVCYCKQISKAEIVRAIHDGATTLAAVKSTTGACTGNRCKELNPKGRCCSADIIGLIKDTVGAGRQE